MNHRAESFARRTRRGGGTGTSSLDGRIFSSAMENARGRKSIPTARLLELITRSPGGIPSILNNPRDPNHRLMVERKRVVSLPLLLPLLLSFSRKSRVASDSRANRERCNSSVCAQREISLSLSLFVLSSILLSFHQSARSGN